MYKYINWIIFAFVVAQMALSAKHNEVCRTIAWGVMTLGVWMGLLAIFLKDKQFAVIVARVLADDGDDD